ncbi:hypothetical protein M885DRAFT_436402 [Pelagophyceae sp. CCMP2097]|nr:hypothetical protein M885DRAFT_436402 [Pelagophyceae sp. CCMP2097]
MSLDDFAARRSNSWVENLNEDPEAARYAPNKRSREVKSGHYVRVLPTPLPRPVLVMHSPDMVATLGLTEAAVADARFAKFFGGDAQALDLGASWATPYALSIMGEPMFRNCPFGNGNGYGDGRAISVGEVVVPGGARWELQLKGAGTTPFCRGADGRAVLRSSVREFLASEAMFALGVPTTRALSLVSSGETARRAWYSKTAGAGNGGVDENDPRLASFPEPIRKRLVAQLRAQLAGGTDPDVASDEQCAITCRVAPSFLRVGHVDLFARRAVSTGATPAQRDELWLLVKHACDREFPDALADSRVDTAVNLVPRVAQALADLAANWIRVGFCQGNFNADNCLISGRTMDYGPFGFIDKYDPLFAKWTGSGEHFAFMNQPGAAMANFNVFAKSLEPLAASADDRVRIQQAAREAAPLFRAALEDVWRAKLGFSAPNPAAAKLFSDVDPLLRALDYTVFWRQLAVVAENFAPDQSDDELVAPLARALYADSWDEPLKAALAQWVRKWADSLGGDLASAPARMNQSNPKYILREWMLVAAYEAAQRGDFSVAKELQEICKKPYEDQAESVSDKYFRPAPKDEVNRPGTAFMT